MSHSEDLSKPRIHYGSLEETLKNQPLNQSKTLKHQKTLDELSTIQ
jgi:hypothetical protein